MLLSNELSTTGLHNPRTWELRGIIMSENKRYSQTRLSGTLYQVDSCQSPENCPLIHSGGPVLTVYWTYSHRLQSPNKMFSLFSPVFVNGYQ